MSARQRVERTCVAGHYYSQREQGGLNRKAAAVSFSLIPPIVDRKVYDGVLYDEEKRREFVKKWSDAKKRANVMVRREREALKDMLVEVLSGRGELCNALVLAAVPYVILRAYNSVNRKSGFVNAFVEGGAYITDTNFLLPEFYDDKIFLAPRDLMYVTSRVEHTRDFFANAQGLHPGFFPVWTGISRTVNVIVNECELCGAEADLTRHHVVPRSLLHVLALNDGTHFDDRLNVAVLCSEGHNQGRGIEGVISLNERLSHALCGDSFVGPQMFYLDYAMLLACAYLKIDRHQTKLLTELDELARIGAGVLQAAGKRK
ncbi:hypothetical protein HY992_05170 [Candidatus Micrarchaeota archaeon]|nr:hypothetical protein [Candidatus Micrarchaeota archaeon]